MDNARAAGVLFQAPDGEILLLRRTDDHNYWSIPAGHIEGEETAEQAARREVTEETGKIYDGQLWPLLHRVKDGVDFHSYLAQVPKFEPILNGEHDLYRWSTIEDALNQGGLHPGMAVALLRPEMDELDIARMMKIGEIASPEPYHNMLIIALRITGTGASYRLAHKEFVWRDPSLYLNDEFLARANGLPVILEHPDGAQLDSEEFHNRIVGSIVLPYIKGDEVWGIAKIWDDAVSHLLQTRKLSTSPAVVFRPETEGERVPLVNGSHILVEGQPSLLDHLAICELGVWDKGGDAAGVLNSTLDGVNNMAETKEVKPDAATGAVTNPPSGEPLDTILKGIETIGKRLDRMDARMDAFEKSEKEDEPRKDDDDDDKHRKDAKRKDAEDEPPAMKDDDKHRKDDDDDDHKRKDAHKDDDDDKHRKDASGEDDTTIKRKDAETEAEKEKAARADSAMISTLTKQVAELRARMPMDLSSKDAAEFLAEQGRADKVAIAFGDNAPTAQFGESLNAYRRRLIGLYKHHSPTWKEVNIAAIDDAQALKNIGERVYADAMNAALHPVSEGGPMLRSVSERDATGRSITKFYGDARATWGPFTLPARALVGIRSNFDQKYN